MNLPGALVTQVREGKVVLLLGGASLDSTTEQGESPPSSEQLAELLLYRGGKSSLGIPQDHTFARDVS